MMAGGYARFVDCTFSGTLRKVVFNGSVRADKSGVFGRDVNEFRGDDFSRAKSVDVAFRTGSDLDQQRLPGGDEYVFLEDAPEAVRRARAAFEGWDDLVARDCAKGVLHVMERNIAQGQMQLLMRADDFPRSTRRAIRALLEAALAS